MENGRRLFSGECKFTAGAATAASIPPSRLPEVAFAGRSNAGKSSLLNALTGRKALARVSQSPGRTRQINFFRLADRLMLADLPGYGFARASKTEQARWSELITDYLMNRASLRRLVLLIDARRGIMDSDSEVMKLLDDMAISYQLVLTKSDLLGEDALNDVIARVRDETRRRKAAFADVVATSAESNRGIAELRASLAGLTKR